MPYDATWDAYDFLMSAHGYDFSFDNDYMMEISGPFRGIKNVEIILI